MTRSRRPDWLKPKKHGNGRVIHWVADLRPIGQGREFFPLTPQGKAECQAMCNNVLALERQHGASAVEALTLEQFGDAAKAFALLEDRPISLTEIVRAYCKKNSNKIEPIQVGEAIEQYERHMRSSGRRPATIKSAVDKATRLGKYVRRSAHTTIFTPDKLKAYFEANGFRENTLRTVYTELSVFFDWLVQERRLRENPLAGMKKPAKVYRDIEILKPPEKLQTLLNAAADCDPNLIIPIALRFFAGLRPGEIHRPEEPSKNMRPEDIDLETGFIRVASEGSKVKRERLVRIEPNLRKILTDWEPWDLSFSAYRWKQVCAQAGFVDEDGKATISPKIARKSYISYHLAHYKDENLTVRYAGNSVRVATEHYIGLVSEAQAEQYWSITV